MLTPFLYITPSSAAGKLGAGFALFAKAVTGLPVCLDEFVGRSRYRGEKPLFYTFPTMS